MKKINAETFAAILLLFFAIVFFHSAGGYNYNSADGGPGPGFFGVWLSGMLAVLAIIYIFQSLKATNTKKTIVPDGEALKGTLAIIGTMFGFSILLPILGFVCTSIIFMLILFKSNYSWIYSAAVSVTVSFSLFVLFQIVLNIQLPVLIPGYF